MTAEMDAAEPRWQWPRTRRQIPICPVCGAMVAPDWMARHEWWHDLTIQWYGGRDRD